VKLSAILRRMVCFGNGKGDRKLASLRVKDVTHVDMNKIKER